MKKEIPRTRLQCHQPSPIVNLNHPGNQTRTKKKSSKSVHRHFLSLFSDILVTTMSHKFVIKWHFTIPKKDMTSKGIDASYNYLLGDYNIIVYNLL